MNPSTNTFVEFIFASLGSAPSERREEIFRSIVGQTSDVAVATLFTHAADRERAHRDGIDQMRFDFVNGRLALPKSRTSARSHSRKVA